MYIPVRLESFVFSLAVLKHRYWNVQNYHYYWNHVVMKLGLWNKAWKNSGGVWEASRTVLLTKYYYPGRQYEKNVAERTCSTCEKVDVHKWFCWRNIKVKACFWKHRNKWGYNIKADVKEIEWEGVALVYLTQDKDKWRAVVNNVINLPVLQNAEKFVGM
jgi:hypothetical protein